MLNNIKALMEKQQYRIVGNHSAVKICHWTKKSLRDEGACYKEQFYGIKSHRCLQMSPCITCCNACVYCWRDTSIVNTKWSGKIGEPKNIIKNCIKAQRELLSGFKGFSRINMQKWNEAQNPNQAAISLIGEPTLYPKLSELIKEFHRQKFTTFLVTNGQYPEKLEKLSCEPTQLYISLDAPDKKTYEKIDIPKLKDFWQRLNKSLELMSSFSCKKVIRLTLVKGWNMKNIGGYAKLIKKANPDFVECKAYMWIGESQKRLPLEAMPLHKEVNDFALRLNKFLAYKVKGENKESRVILLSNR